MSTAILMLSENGTLQKIRDKWLNKKKKGCGWNSQLVESDKLNLTSFWGLFLICGTACFLALLVYFCLIVRKFSRYFPDDDDDQDDDELQQDHPHPPLGRGRGGIRSARVHRFFSFVNEKEDVSKNKLKRKRAEMSSSSTTTGRRDATVDGPSPSSSSLRADI